MTKNRKLFEWTEIDKFYGSKREGIKQIGVLFVFFSFFFDKKEKCQGSDCLGCFDVKLGCK